ncbi:E3 ubiquitin-protein ligase rbbp6 [Linnemannia hyalina]|uniref:E3 ubiquitin-protein ligase rbbp6 n=1 Tax=Linnemannia hyalina TaxID=64524 RepID=A0A9P7Y1T9_9FUNG|nr:E3 ubiquitin-protein ligase rbbp6 [Linnemannia hyalina]
MSKVHYKFKSSKDYDSATFDGHSISVFDLKKEILIAKGLKGPDDLALTHAESGEEYYDDATLIPRNTSILVARVPAKPGRGGAQRYLEGAGPIPRGGNMSRNVFEKPGSNNHHDPMGGSKVYRNTTSLLQEEGPPTEAVDMSQMTEEEKMKFVFEQQTSHWGKTQEGMANAQFRPLSKFQGATRNQPQNGPRPTGEAGSGAGSSNPGSFPRQPMDQQQRPPPNTYVCYRCGKKGEHWIQFCPTNNDKSFEPIGIKKTTGIPRSFLKTVKSDTLQSKKGVMVTQDGNLVVATTNDYEWKKFHEKSKGTLTSDEAYNTAPIPDDMKCIRNYLVHPPKGEDPFKCRSCHQYLVPDQLIPNVDLRQSVEHHLRDWAKSRRMEADGQGGAGSTGPGSRGGSPFGDMDKTDSLLAKPSGDTNSSSIDGEGSAAAGQKRRLSNDNSQAAAGGLSGDLDRDQPSWKNKKPHVNNHVSNNSNSNSSNINSNNNSNNLSNNQGMSRNRPPPMHGSGAMGPIDPSMMDPHLMFPEGIPPGFFEMMQQHDPALFMDPNMFGPNGVPQFMMPGFVPPFMPEFGGMPGQGGPSGPEMWNMGRGIPGLPPMGPGFPTPRIGFSEPRAGRGRGRGGGWQESGQNDHGGPIAGGGRGYPQEFNQNGPQGIPAPGGNSGAPFTPAGAGAGAGTTRATSASGDNAREANGHRNASQDPPGRFDDDDIDMSQVPTGPRAARRLPLEDDEEIPKGPRAGPGPEDDRRRSESPPTAPLADRLRYRSTSRSRSDKAADNNSIGSSGDRDRSRQRETKDNRHKDREGSSRDRDRHRDHDRSRDRERDRDRDFDRSRDKDRERDSDRDRRRDDSRDRRDDRSRSSRHDRERDRARDSSNRRDDRRDNRRDDRKADGRQEDGRSSSHQHQRHRKDRSRDNYREDETEMKDNHQQHRHDRESSSSSSTRKSVDPQRDYEMKRQASFGASMSTSTSLSRQQGDSMKGYEESNVYKYNSEDRPGQGQHSDSQRERGHGRRGYGDGNGNGDDGDRGNDGGDDRVHFRKRGGEYEKQQQAPSDLSVTGLVSQSARERERADRERRSYRD